MTLRTHDNDNPQCMLYAFAMCLDIDPQELEAEVGHKGENSYHWVEFIEPCIKRGYIPLHYHIFPAQEGRDEVWSVQECIDRADNILVNRIAVLIKDTHAVALNDDGIIYDPKGFRRMYSHGMASEAFILIRGQV